MNELVYLKNDEPVCSSLQVAEKFGKRHTHVIERIEKIIENDSTENSAQCFKASIYKDSTGKSNKMYVMNRDGFTFLVMGFTGKKANEWKWQYIKAFNQMEKFIREKQTKIWIETRKAGKLTRKAETDTIKNLVEYAKAQGSQHADKLYMTYSKLANKMAGVSKRDEATVMQLNNLSLMEHIILCVIDSGIVAGKHYKEIYQDCKKRLETVKDLAYLEQSAQEDKKCKKIKCFDYCGDKNAFIPLLGFALSDISETLDEEEKEIITLVFTNDHHVAIDISVQDGRVMISEPYAVKEDLTAITDEEAAA